MVQLLQWVEAIARLGMGMGKFFGYGYGYGSYPYPWVWVQALPISMGMGMGKPMGNLLLLIEQSPIGVTKLNRSFNKTKTKTKYNNF